MVFTTAALEIEIHFVTSQTVVLALAAVAAVAVVAVAVAMVAATAEVACGSVGIETTTKRRLFIAQWVLPLKLFVHHNRFRWIH